MILYQVTKNKMRHRRRFYTIITFKLDDVVHFSNRNNALDPVRNYGGKNGTV